MWATLLHQQQRCGETDFPMLWINSMSRATLCGVANYPNSDCGVGNFSNSGSVVLAINQYQTLRCLQFLKFRLCGVVNNTEPDSAVLVITQSKTLSVLAKSQLHRARLSDFGNSAAPDLAVLAIMLSMTLRCY